MTYEMKVWWSDEETSIHRIGEEAMKVIRDSFLKNINFTLIAKEEETIFVVAQIKQVEFTKLS